MTGHRPARTVLRGALVADGTGAPAAIADIAWSGPLISAVGRVPARPGDRVIDGTGLVAMPGFIDAHTHASPALRPGAAAEHLALLSQGITTVLLGQDGTGWAPADGPGVAWAQEYFGSLDGEPPDALRGGGSVAGLLAAWDRSAPVNVAYLAPAGLIRHGVLGGATRPADRAEVAAMARLVAAALGDGAVGLSTGLEYVPGAFAAEAELAGICAPVAEAGAVHVSHMRGYGQRAPGSIAELGRVAVASGVRTHVSHLRGRAGPARRALAAARAAGADVTFDSYPYHRACTLLAMRCLPPELQAGGPAAAAGRLADAATYRRLRRSWHGDLRDELAGYVISNAPGPAFGRYEGRTLADAAAAHGCDLAGFVRELLAGTGLAVTCVVPGRGSDGDRDYAALLADPGRMAGSDGIYLGGHPHPRGRGAFARMLRRDVVERSLLSWGEASWQLAGHAAARFGLAGRGRLGAGYAADIAVCDPDAVRDLATYARPARTASGMAMAFVNGELAYSAGGGVATAAAHAGRALRRGGSGP